MARQSKNRCELLLPAENGWARWIGSESGPLDVDETFADDAVFSRDAQRHVLAIPATGVWVLPAWIKGEAAHLRDMAQLHLERLGVRASGAEHELQINRVAADDAAHLVCILALKDQPASIASASRLPTDAAISAACYPLPQDSIIIWRELGKLVVAITSGDQLIYFSPLSATKLDEAALAELNNTCMQLSFQRVLGKVERIVLWMEDSDPALVRRAIGIETMLETKPAPQIPVRGRSSLMPSEIIAERARQKTRSRNRMLALGAGALAAGAIAVIAALTVLSGRERDALRERVAELSPRAAKVEDHRKSWDEVAAATDPKRFPMEVLLRCMEPPCSAEVMLTHFECAPDRVIIRGRTPASHIALQYTQAIKTAASLAAFTWETPPPSIAGDDSASFELKGDRR